MMWMNIRPASRRDRRSWTRTKGTSSWLLLSALLLLSSPLGYPVRMVSAAWTWGSTTKATTQENAEESNLAVMVSPIVNRQLETTVKAHGWPTTPQSMFCEAFAFHMSSSPETASVYLDRLVQLVNMDENTGTWTMEKARDVALQASPTVGTERGLLKLALALRAASPLCETHRVLARQVVLEQQTDETTTNPPSVMAVLYPSGTVIYPDELPSIDDWSALLKTTATASTQKWEDFLLPGEVPRVNDNTTSSSVPLLEHQYQQFVVLYGNFGTPAFGQSLATLAAQPVPLVVRHMGVVHYEEDASLASPTTLQGYGVRVDIRNVEYKVFDDRRASGGNAGDGTESGTIDGALNLTAQPEHVPGDLLAGIDLDRLELFEDHDVKLKLWKLHEEQQLYSQKVPPAWQRRQLPLQAATVIAQADNPLATLSEIAQNLPSLASLLVNVKIPENVSSIAEIMENTRNLPLGRMFVNGRTVALDSPSFNVFEILNKIREEGVSLRRLEDTFKADFSEEGLQLLQDAWMQGEHFETSGVQDDEHSSPLGQSDKAVRVDVGTGWRNAVIYLNDIEKDAEYSRWPRSVQGMIQAMQYGMPPVVRRNVFTVLAVIDPIKNPAQAIFQLGMQLMQNNYPARVGVLWINEDDVDECRAWIQTQPNLEGGEPCPTSAVITSRKDLSTAKATAKAAHRLLTEVVEKYGEPEITLAFAEYLLSSLEQTLQTNDDLTLQGLVDLFAEIMSGMGISDLLNSADTAIEALMDSSPNYGHSLRFAADKRLRPEMGFLNGRPLDGSDTTAISNAFGQEQQHIFTLIMTQEITDTSPRSIYAKLLSGDKVYKKVHPLLFGSGGEGASHVFLDHDFGPGSLIVPNSIENPQAFFVAESVLDYASEGGFDALVALLESVGDFPTHVEDRGTATDVSIGYRVLPASNSDAKSPLCPLLSKASDIGLELLKKILSDFKHSGFALSLDQLVTLLPENVGPLDFRSCDSIKYMDSEWEPKQLFLLNGRSFVPDGGAVTGDDMELLLETEYARARAVFRAFRAMLGAKTLEGISTLGKVGAFLAAERAMPIKRSNVLARILDLEEQNDLAENVLRFHVPAVAESDNALTTSITVVIDPVSEAAQRISPLLEVFSAQMHVPIDVIMAPPTIIDGDSKIPITSYYRFVAEVESSSTADSVARFSNLPTNHILTIRMDVPEPWDVQQTRAVQDTDNLRCDVISGCSDLSYESEDHTPSTGIQLTSVEYGLSSLLVFGQCYETTGSPPNGLQLVLTRHVNQKLPDDEAEINIDGSTHFRRSAGDEMSGRYSDTLVMKTVGYWQLRANPGVWDVRIAEESKGASMFDFVESTVTGGRIKVEKGTASLTRKIVLNDFVNRGETLIMQRRPGFETESLFDEEPVESHTQSDETINVFSLATGHLYERFLKIMMLSVTKRTSSKVKFWLFENFLSPNFKATAKAMSDRIGCEVEFVTYKWPEWLRGQSEKQRIIWGYKILFLDVLFPLDVKKIIYVDADQVVRGDLKELHDMDLQGAPYGYTPFCTSRESTLGYQFWREGFWKSHLRGKPYHISALYVVDLERFRRTLVGDQLRATYQQLSADPHSLSNLDQDLPNYAQHAVPIFSLPQDWLWCESWCSDESKATAKTIDLCNNPMHKEPKKSMAIRVISGPLFNESWVELDAEVEGYEREYFASLHRNGEES